MDLQRKILNDLRVELSDEFDRNFQRKAFFDYAWPPRKSGGKGSLLMQTGRLRRSIRCREDILDTVKINGKSLEDVLTRSVILDLD